MLKKTIQSAQALDREIDQLVDVFLLHHVCPPANGVFTQSVCERLAVAFGTTGENDLCPLGPEDFGREFANTAGPSCNHRCFPVNLPPIAPPFLPSFYSIY